MWKVDNINAVENERKLPQADDVVNLSRGGLILISKIQVLQRKQIVFPVSHFICISSARKRDNVIYHLGSARGVQLRFSLCTFFSAAVHAGEISIRRNKYAIAQKQVVNHAITSEISFV